MRSWRSGRACPRPTGCESDADDDPDKGGSWGGAHAPPDPSCLLEFRNIRIVYDNAIEAIRDVSIAVPEGGIVALLGSNGAGKSTLLKAMSGILYTEEGVLENGTIRFRNEDVHHLAPDELVRHGIVQVPEGRRVFPSLTIDENLQMGGYTKTTAAARERREKVFALFPRLFERRDQIAGYMSGGEQQMLAIGRALMTRSRAAGARRAVVGPRAADHRPDL